MQTILGSGGAIGIELAKALTAYTSNIRLVSRHPQKVNPTDEVVAADVLKPEQLRSAIEGSDIVYVTAGFPYSYAIWKESWPPFIKSLLGLCRELQCNLVFFDNMYIYDPQHLNGMTEQTPVNPSSKKGTLRAEIVRMIQDEVEKGMGKILGLFDPTMRETVEMMYQYNRDYVFNSNKIEQAFDLAPTPYEEGIQQIIRIDYKVPV